MSAPVPAGPEPPVDFAGGESKSSDSPTQEERRKRPKTVLTGEQVLKKRGDKFDYFLSQFKWILGTPAARDKYIDVCSIECTLCDSKFTVVPEQSGRLGEHAVGKR